MDEQQEKLLDETFDETSEEEGLEEQEETSEKEEQEEVEEEENEEGQEEEVSAEEELETLLNSDSDEGEASEDPDLSEEEEEEGSEEEDEKEEVELSLDNDLFEDVTSSPEALQKYAEKIYSKARKDSQEDFKKELATAREEIKQEILQNIPDVVSKSAKRMQNVKTLTANFYKNNPVLKEKRGYVKDMVANVSSQNPDWGAKEVLDEVAKRAKRDLDLTQQAKTREQKRKNLKFAGAGGRRNPSGGQDTRSKQEKLLDETFS